MDRLANALESAIPNVRRRLSRKIDVIGNDCDRVPSVLLVPPPVRLRNVNVKAVPSETIASV